MDIPLPVQFSQQPGGLVGMYNALREGYLKNQNQQIQNQYLPLTSQADAASKLAYANLMGPQFLAKMMGNEDILANMSPDQRTQALQMLYRAGSGQGTEANALTNPMLKNMLQTNQEQSPLQKILGSVGNAFGMQSPNQQQAPINALMQQPNLSAQDKNAIANMQPGQSYTIQGNQIPAKMNAPAMQPPAPQGANTFAENVGNYAGIKAEGKEAGNIRAKDIKELNDIYFNAGTQQATLDDINNMISSPEIRQIRQVPLAGRHEMGYYAKEGTPAQQQLIGRIYSQMGNVIKNSARDFPGAFRKGEQGLLNGMKPNDNDTVDVMIGKAESLSVMNMMLQERAKLTSQYMNQYHINKLQAEELADKQVNGNKIRRSIHDKLNPTITLRNPKTGEQVTIPISEARQGGFNG